MVSCDSEDTPELVAFKASWGYALFAAIVVALYTVVFGVALFETVRRCCRRNNFATNNAQVTILILIGSAVRAAYFVVQFLSPEWVRDLLLAVAQVTWVGSFALVVFFWMEMQLTVQRIDSVRAYRLQLLVTTVGYSVARLLQTAFRSADDVAWVNAVRVVLTVAIYVFYVLLFGFAAFWSWRLWRRMVGIMRQVSRGHSSGFFQRKLRKLTLVIVLEIVFAALFFVLGGVRFVFTFLDADMRCTDPTKYVLIGLPHYATEYVLIVVLCASIVVSPNHKEAAERKAAMTSSTATRTRSSVSGATGKGGSAAIAMQNRSSSPVSKDTAPLVIGKGDEVVMMRSPLAVVQEAGGRASARAKATLKKTRQTSQRSRLSIGSSAADGAAATAPAAASSSSNAPAGGDPSV